MYSNLLKRGTTCLQDTETRVIDTNELAQRRISELAEKMARPENAGFMDELVSEGEEGGFVSGLSAETIDGLLSDSEDADGAPGGNVIKGAAESAAILQQAREEAAAILEEARKKAAAEAEELRAQAQAALAKEREEALEQARTDGYAEGEMRAQEEFRVREKQLEEEYQNLVDGLEPQFIDTITGIYEHVFQVELSSYREILVYLISSTLRSASGSRSYLVHVSKDDFPYVSMQKKQICQNLMAPNSELEIVEDITLGQNECMIETEGGIFDCGLGTQLAELNQRLRLLSYERS